MSPSISDLISRSEGSALFGSDSASDEEARPDYPERVYDLLVERCGLADSCWTIEVGAGSGQATRRIAELGARPLIASLLTRLATPVYLGQRAT